MNNFTENNFTEDKTADSPTFTCNAYGHTLRFGLAATPAAINLHTRNHSENDCPPKQRVLVNKTAATLAVKQWREQRRQGEVGRQ